MKAASADCSLKELDNVRKGRAWQVQRQIV